MKWMILTVAPKSTSQVSKCRLCASRVPACFLACFIVLYLLRAEELRGSSGSLDAHLRLLMLISLQALQSGLQAQLQFWRVWVEPNKVPWQSSHNGGCRPLLLGGIVFVPADAHLPAR